jgi:hypothetical protein
MNAQELIDTAGVPIPGNKGLPRWKAHEHDNNYPATNETCVIA